MMYILDIPFRRLFLDDGVSMYPHSHTLPSPALPLSLSLLLFLGLAAEHSIGNLSTGSPFSEKAAR